MLPKTVDGRQGTMYCPDNKRLHTIAFHLHHVMISPWHLWRGDVGISPVYEVDVDCDSQPRHEQEEKQSPSSVQRDRYNRPHFLISVLLKHGSKCNLALIARDLKASLAYVARLLTASHTVSDTWDITGQTFTGVRRPQLIRLEYSYNWLGLGWGIDSMAMGTGGHFQWAWLIISVATIMLEIFAVQKVAHLL